MLLGWPTVELTGITTVTDDADVRAGMAAYVLGLAAREDVPVASGAEGAIGARAHPAALGDPARYWPEPVEPIRSPPGEALDLLAASIDRGATVVAIGPWTNLALLEVARPGILRGARVVLMGGSIASFDWTGLPGERWIWDYNVNQDPVAARIVLERCEPVLVPLPVTLRATLRSSHLDDLRGRGPIADLVARQAVAYAEENGYAALAKEHDGLPEDLLNFQHDPIACAAALGWHGVTIEELPVAIRDEDGGLRVAVEPGGMPMRVATAVDDEAFASDFLAAVRDASPGGRA